MGKTKHVPVTIRVKKKGKVRSNGYIRRTLVALRDNLSSSGWGQMLHWELDP